jgi:lipoprotein-anchoring transpeptidase ErfK/SrfK
MGFIMVKANKVAATGELGSVKNFRENRTSAKKTGNWIKRHSVVLLTIACLLIISGGVAFLLAKYNAAAAPGTNIAGSNVSGQNALAIRDDLNQVQGKIQLTLSYHGKTITARASDLGINIDIDKTMAQALLTSNNWLNRINLFGQHNIKLIANYDWAQTQKFLNQNFPELITSPAQNAGVIYDAQSQKFVTQASVEGKVIDMDKIKQIIEDLVARPRAAVADVAITTSKPDVSDTAAQTAADFANARIASRINLQVDGKTIYYPDPVDVADWTTFTPNGGQLNVTFDQSKIRSFVAGKVQGVLPGKPVNGKTITSADGNTVYATLSQGQNGEVINNGDDAARQIISALQNGQSTNITLTTTNAPAQNDKTATLADQHWIDANLTNWTITAYNGTQPVAQFTNFAKGAAQLDPERATITGLFKVFSKVGGNDSSGAAAPNSDYATNLAAGMGVDRSGSTNSNPYGGVCMPNPGGTQANLCSIHYVTYWGPGGYAFHEAWWLTPAQVHTGLSHGCLNMWKGDAKWIYDFSQIGTPVWVHY